MKTILRLFPVLLFVIGGLAGYSLRSWNAASTFIPSNGIPKLDDLIGPESFSRVQNTEAILSALSLRVRIQAQTSLYANEKLPPGPEQEQGFGVILSQLEAGMQEFAGTEQECEFLQERLLALKSRRHFAQWTALYTRALYERPTHPVVIRFAADAIAIARSTGREEEMLAALSHLMAIPLDFAGKNKIAAMMARSSGLVTQGSPALPENHPGS